MLANKQRHLCPWCMQTLYNNEALEKHHLIPVNKGGSNMYKNLVWLHKICHQAVSKPKKETECFEILKTNLSKIQNM